MRIYALFIIAFVVIAAGFFKSRMGNIKNNSNKKQRVTLAEPQWPGVMKKTSVDTVAPLRTNKTLKAANVDAAESKRGESASNLRKAAKRGIASIGPAPSRTEWARKRAFYTVGAEKFKPRGYTSDSFYYGVYTPESMAAQSQSALTSRQPSNSNVNDLSAQELSSFTRTTDLSINVSMEPELAETFEDQVRKFREQNQLTSQELQQLEAIINSFVSMSNSVQRGQVPLPQVNAEAIKLTRGFLNLKKRVEARAQLSE